MDEITTSFFFGFGMCLVLIVFGWLVFDVAFSQSTDVVYIQALTPFTECHEEYDPDMIVCKDYNQTCEITGNVDDGFKVRNCYENKPLTCLGC